MLLRPLLFFFPRPHKINHQALLQPVNAARIMLIDDHEERQVIERNRDGTRFSRALLPRCPCCIADNIFLPPQVAGEEASNIGFFSGRQNNQLDLNDAEASNLSDVKIPTKSEALDIIKNGGHSVVMVDTHGHPQLERQDELGKDTLPRMDDENNTIISLACAVSPEDWETTLSYASHPSRCDTTLPALGVHPWYIYPNLRTNYLEELEEKLLSHPGAVVGEIGLCKVAKFVRSYPKELGGRAGAMELQRKVFDDQFKLAARLCRPVSVHCVQQHGVFVKMLKETREEALKSHKIMIKARWEKKRVETITVIDRKDDNSCIVEQTLEHRTIRSFPLAVAMHSFTGTAHHVKELLDFEATLHKNHKIGSFKTKKKESDSIQHPPLFYFGFSHSVNVAMCSSLKSRTQGINAIRAVPLNRLLAESDVHCTDEVQSGTAGAIAYLAAATGTTVLDMAKLTMRNGMTFLATGKDQY